MDCGDRGTGRTTRALQKALEEVFSEHPPRVAFFVVANSKHDGYCFRIVTKGREELIQKYSMHSRTIHFKNDGRLHFISFDSEQLFQMAPGHWRVRGYRADTPVVWDHEAEDQWTMREAERIIKAGMNANSPPRRGRRK